jgi:tripartite-type tricarboxylate transporter receptor subunit TctC
MIKLNKTSIRKCGRVLGVLALLAGFCSATWAEVYPSRPVTMVVPFPPGGVADTVGRPVAESMAQFLGQPIVVDNKAGAGGGIGMAQVARSKPDGLTLLMALVSISTIPVADEVLGRSPSFVLNQFKPIARFTADPTVLAVRADAPWQTFQEFVDYVRKNPDKLNFGSSGNYGTMHVPVEMLKLELSLKMTHVPYKGAGPAVLGLLGKEIDFVATGPSSIVAQVKAGKVRVLAHWGEGRLAALPDVPSLKSLGVNIQFDQWSGLFVPASTPDPIIQRLRQAARAAAQDEKVISTILKAGSPIEYLDAPEFQSYWDADAKVLDRIVRKIGRVE